MNGPQEKKLTDLLETAKEIEFWVKRIAQRLGADKGLDAKDITESK